MTEYQRAAGDGPLRELLTGAVGDVSAAEGAILLLSEDGASLEFVLNTSPGEEKLIGLRQPLGKGITGLAFTLQQPMVVNDVSRDASFDPTVQERSGVSTRSIMVVPLVSPEAEFGALTAINAESGAFSNLDLESFSEKAGRIVTRLAELNLSLPAPNDGDFE